MNYLGEQSRRQLLKRSGVVAIGATVGGVLGACDLGGDGDSATTTAGPKLSGAQRKELGDYIYGGAYDRLPYGGTVVGAFPGFTPTTLDALATPDYATYHQSDPNHDWLERYDHRSTLRPSLASEHRIVNQTTLEYRLRDNLFFHNGDRVTAQDVRDTVEYIQNPNNQSAVSERLSGVDVRIVDERTVQLKLAEPNAGFRANLTRMPIVPVSEAKRQATHPIGCGPYIFERWVRDGYTEHRRNPKYWNPLAPRAQRLRLQIIKDADAAANAFLADQMDFNAVIPFARIEEFRAREREGRSGLYQLAGGGWTYLAFNHAKRPLDNPQVREAIRLGIDRKQMVDSAFNGESFPLYAAGITPDHPYYAGMKPAIEYQRDVEKAKSLLSRAGFPNGFSIKLLGIDRDYFQALSTITKSNLADIGIDVELEVVDLATYLDRGLAKKDYDMGILGAALDNELSSVLDPFFASKGNTNYFNYSNPRLDRLFRQGVREYDERKRAQIYSEAMRLALIEDTAIVPYVKETFISAYRIGVNGGIFQNSPDQRRHYPLVAKGAAG